MKTKFVAALILLLITLSSAFQFSYATNDEYMDPSELEGKIIGVEGGSDYATGIYKIVKNPIVKLYNNDVDLIAALKTGKIDAVLSDESQLQYVSTNADGIICRRVKGNNQLISPITAKSPRGEDILKEFNQFISEIKASGDLEKLIYKWLKGTEDERIMKDYTALPGKRGTITVGTYASYPPYEYVKNNQLVGFDIELTGMFCERFGYKPDYKNVDFDGIIAGVVAGKYDIGASAFSQNKERAKVINFTDTVYEECAGVATRVDSRNNLINKIKDGFTNTFITESRWKSFLSGIYVTMLITIASIILGTALGFVAHMLYRKESKTIKKIMDYVSWLIQGLPDIVFLMILFYIVFGSSQISATIVSIIAFTLSFTCTVRDMLKFGEDSVDIGQVQAATALGYRKNAIFFKIILPQAVKKILPSYIDSLSDLIQATSIVGYIAVVDVTKVGDIIRGRTFDAFFPLISVAILYFIMTGILKYLARIVSEKTEDRQRKKNEIIIEIEDL